MKSINVIIMIAALAVDFENNASRAQVCVCVGGIISLPLPGARSEANHQALRLQGQDDRNSRHGVKETNLVHKGQVGA